ncbi:MAG: orotidine-5'-phosphate decarboxylase [Acidobacteria bacterium]|nr:orotidine-5'-phosphate decarboxylase [Acidobacteriota bacterium]
MTAPKIDTENSARSEDRLIVALDVDTAEKARSLVADLNGVVTTFKIGLQLFSAAGPKFVEELAADGKRIFLDLKFHDIPNTVARAGVEAARLGVWMFNVHAAGGSEMMKTTAAAVGEFCSMTNSTRPHIIAVTVLTSSDSNVLGETGIEADVETQVRRLAKLTAESGLDGVVASAREIGIVRSSVQNEGFLIVTPGIRPENATNDDQKRVTTPGTAISNGADHIVVGRPVTGAPDPREAAEKILNEIGRAA